MSRIRVAVAMGGRSAERDVSLRSGEAVLKALDPARHETERLVLEPDGWFRLGDDAPAPPEEGVAALRRRRFDVVFLALHGPGGEDGTMQGFLEVAGVPYTGSGVAASAIAMDKCATRALLAGAGVRVAPAEVVGAAEWRDARREARARIGALGRPVFVKAPTQGSSFGVTPVETEDDAELDAAMESALRYEPRVLVERCARGVEVTSPVLGNADDPEIVALPPVEIRPRRGRFFDTREKYAPDGAEEICPPRSLSAEAIAEVARLGVLAHRTLRCDGMSRSDWIVTPEGPVVLEVNTIPGLTERSLLPLAAAAAGLSFPALVARIVELALRRFGRA